MSAAGGVWTAKRKEQTGKEVADQPFCGNTNLTKGKKKFNCAPILQREKIASSKIERRFRKGSQGRESERENRKRLFLCFRQTE